MLKLYLFIVTMAITMSSPASDGNNPKVFLHKDFYEKPVKRTPPQQSMDFFRTWLLDDFGRKIVQQVLQEKAGFDTKKSLQIISFMDKTIAHIDQKTHVLYTTQQANFVKQYNQNMVEEEKATSFQQIHIDRVTLLKAEAKIQRQIDTETAHRLSQLAAIIGKQSAADLQQFIHEVHALSENPPPVDPDEYLKEISESTNNKLQNNLVIDQDGTAIFGVIKKER